MARAKEVTFQASPHVLGGGRVISAPFQYLVEGDHHLKIEGWNTAANARLQVSYRFAGVDGAPRDERAELALTADRVVAEAHVGLQPGYLLNMCVFVTGASPLIGQTFVCIKLIRGLGEAAIVVGLLLQGYVTAEQGLGWPGSPIADSIAGGGCVRTIAGTNPAAGSEVVESVPTGARWELMGLSATLQASATVASRRPSLTYTTGGVRVARLPIPIVLAANESQQLIWDIGCVYESNVDPNVTIGPLPIDFVLQAGDQIRTVTAGLQANDDWAAPRLMIREWLEAS